MHPSSTDESFLQNIRRAKAQIAALLGGKQEEEPGTTLEAATRVAGRSQSASAASQKGQPVNRKERALFSAAVKPGEVAALRNWAQERGAWIPAADLNAMCSPANYLSEGAEQRVYVSRNAWGVIKLNTGFFHGTWLEFFCRTILHNHIFPDVAYSLTGFAEGSEGLVAVIEQPFVRAARGAARDEVEAFMLREGFARTKNDDYYHREHGLILEDLHDENVLMGDAGNILFIDPVIYFETPDMGLGGASQFCFPFAADVWC